MPDFEISDETVLITGGAGFIGSHIADALTPTNEVRILDNLSTGSRQNLPADATLIEGDIRDEETLREAMDGVDLVFHEAALVSVQQSVEQPARSHAINVEATISLLEHAREEDARVVGASSAAIYGEPESVPVTESESKTPTSPYGMDKLSLDHYMRLYNDLYGLETVALRYFNAYGPRQTASDYSGVISIFQEQAENGEPITVNGDGSQTRDFVHIDDIVQANLRAATTSHVGEAYNIGTGSSVTIQQLAETIRRVTNSDSKIIHTEPRPGDIQDSGADITKAQEQLDYTPTVSLEDGLKTIITD